MGFSHKRLYYKVEPKHLGDSGYFAIDLNHLPYCIKLSPCLDNKSPVCKLCDDPKYTCSIESGCIFMNDRVLFWTNLDSGNIAPRENFLHLKSPIGTRKYKNFKICIRCKDKYNALNNNRLLCYTCEPDGK